MGKMICPLCGSGDHIVKKETNGVEQRWECHKPACMKTVAEKGRSKGTFIIAKLGD